MHKIMFMFITLILGTKKISVIACGQTSSMALSDAGEVGVIKGQEKTIFTIYLLINLKQASKHFQKHVHPMEKHLPVIIDNCLLLIHILTDESFYSRNITVYL